MGITMIRKNSLIYYIIFILVQLNHAETLTMSLLMSTYRKTNSFTSEELWAGLWPLLILFLKSFCFCDRGRIFASILQMTSRHVLTAQMVCVSTVLVHKQIMLYLGVLCEPLNLPSVAYPLCFPCFSQEAFQPLLYDLALFLPKLDQLLKALVVRVQVLALVARIQVQDIQAGQQQSLQLEILGSHSYHAESQGGQIQLRSLGILESQPFHAASQCGWLQLRLLGIVESHTFGLVCLLSTWQKAPKAQDVSLSDLQASYT